MLLTAALADHFAAHHGVVALPQLHAFGLTRWHVRTLVEQEILLPVHRGVYRLRSTPVTLEGRCLAACLADADAVITGRAAGKLWNVRCIPHPDRIEVRMPWSSNRFESADVLVRRCPPLPPVDITERDDGIRIVSPPRLVFDLGAVLPDLELESVIEQVLDRRWCTAATLRATCDRLHHPARPGSARVARVLASRPDWRAAADSHLEVVLFDALRSAGVSGLVRQHPVALAGGFTIHADVAVPSLSWLIPIDHVDWHGSRVDVQRDKRADRQAVIAGFHVSRVTDDDIRHDLVRVVDELLAIHALLVRSRTSSG